MLKLFKIRGWGDLTSARMMLVLICKEHVLPYTMYNSTVLLKMQITQLGDTDRLPKMNTFKFAYSMYSNRKQALELRPPLNLDIQIILLYLNI